MADAEAEARKEVPALGASPAPVPQPGMRKEPDAIPPHLPPPAQIPAGNGGARRPDPESSVPTPPRGIPRTESRPQTESRPGYPSPPPQ